MRWTALFALALVVLPGCGGGGDGGQALTKEKYAAKADAICAKTNEQTKELANPKSLAGLVEISDKTVTILDNAIDEFERLHPPPSERGLADQWLEQLRNLRNDVKEIGSKAKENDKQGVRDVATKAQAHNSKSNSLATQLGFSICNKG